MPEKGNGRHMVHGYYSEITEDEQYGKIISLGYRNGSHSSCVQITPEYGFNLFRFAVDEREYIYGDLQQIRETGFTGTPILYPTPNRVRDGLLRVGERTYRQRRHGNIRLMHGLVYDACWEYETPETDRNGIRVSGSVRFDEHFPGFDCFPFRHRLSVTYRLQQDAVRVSYRVYNLAETEITYGFALHTYFYQKQKESRAKLYIPADAYFESDAEKFPTGRINSVAGSQYDLRSGVFADERDIDEVYTGVSGRTCRITYPETGSVLRIRASGEFNQVVIYTPPGQPFFCIENQTCMTDAHNMYAKGLEKESGLLSVKPGESRQGFVEYVAEPGER